jgi:hypothetical protein
MVLSFFPQLIDRLVIWQKDEEAINRGTGTGSNGYDRK